MLTHILALVFNFISLLPYSWSNNGKHTVAIIAERHLTSKTRSAITHILNGRKLSEVNIDSLQKLLPVSSLCYQTYLNVPEGLKQKSFRNYMSGLDTNCMNAVIAKQQEVMVNSHSGKKQKLASLAALVQFITDIHLPFNFGQARENWPISFQNEKIKLSFLWGTKLLEYQGQTPLQLAKMLDTIGQIQVIEPKSFDPIDWAFESYYINSRIHQQVSKNDGLGEAYYLKNIPIINQRLKQAGLRLADVLNAMFDDSPLVPKKPWPADFEVSTYSPVRNVVIDLYDVTKYIGNNLIIHGKICGYKKRKNRLTIYLSATYPRQLFTAIITGDAIEKVEKYYLTPDFLSPKFPNTVYALSVYGKISIRNGRPQVETDNPKFVNSVAMTTIHEPWSDD